ncbi:MAG: PEP-utilizing enzyme, partial [Acidimicrobiia bacterium]
MSGEAENVLHSRTRPEASWSTINLAEAMPGVATPLGWSFWGPAGELGARAPFLAMGALPAAQAAVPDDPEERVINVFFGRVAGRVDFFCEMGDLIPGVTGEGIARDVFGFVPPNYVSRPSRRRWAVCAGKLPATFFRIPSVMYRTRRETEAWWRDELTRHGILDLDGARQQLAGAANRFRDTLALQAINVACGIQPLYEQVGALAKAAGLDGAKLMTGHGSHEETAIIEDLWAVSRDRLTLDAFVARHGYHGPSEGEISGVVWREDAAPVRQLVDSYRSLGDDADPARTVRARAAERAQLEAVLLADLSRARQAKARLL